MLENTRRAFVSLIWVTLAYLIYALAVVPFLERKPAEHVDTRVDIVTVDHSTSTDRFVRELTPHFPDGSWELEDPKVLRSQQVTVLFQDFEQLVDGSLKVKPCTLVYYGKDRGQQQRAKRGPTIMQAPDGAILTFDKPLDLSRPGDAKPVRGQLVGRIWISSTGGPDSDDFVMETSNIFISEKSIYTRERVVFQFGSSYGAGHDLNLKFDSATDDGTATQEEKREFGGLGLITLQHLEQLNLQIADQDMFDAFGNGNAKRQAATNTNATPTQIDVSCDGPLNLDLLQRIATVEDKVVVTRQLEGAPEDRLDAQRLTMHLSANPRPNAKDKSKLALSRVVAMGNSVVIDAPSEEAYVEARYLEYDFNTEKVKLRGFNPFAPTPRDPRQLGRVRLKTPEHQVFVPAVDFVGGDDRSQWQMVAAGPGQYIGLQNDSSVNASWTERLSLQPGNGQQLLKIEGDAVVQSPETGVVRAKSVVVWSKRVHTKTQFDGKRIYKTTPIKLVTRAAHGQQIEIDSPQLHGRLAGLTVHFEGQLKDAPSRNKSSTGMSPFSSNPSSQAKQNPSRYQIVGGDVTIWANLETREPTRLAVSGRTRVVEEAAGNEKPIEIVGDNIEFLRDEKGVPFARVIGAPAVLKSGETEFRGSDIQMIGDQNQIIVPGPGSLRLIVPPDLMSRNTSPANKPSLSLNTASQGADQPIDLSWNDRLQFDGLVATFTGKVEATGTDLSLRTEQLAITFAERIDLSQLGGQQVTPDIATVQAIGGVFAASRSRDEQGNAKSYYQIVTRDLNMDLQTGETIAQGPGWLAVTSKGNGMPSIVGSADKPSDPNQLTQHSVAFGHQLKGNIYRKEAHMSNEIRGWSGPVKTWEDRVDPVSVEKLSDGEYSFSCREVFVMASPSAPPSDGRVPMELLARGNTYIEAQRFAAVGHQIKYAEAKGMLTLEGNQQRLAQLWQRNKVDGPVSQTGRARIIRFWPQSGQLQVDGGLGLDMASSVSQR